jgi:hypothetical protein
VREKPIFKAANQQSEFSAVIFHFSLLYVCIYTRARRVSPLKKFFTITLWQKAARMHFLSFSFQLLLSAAQHCEIFMECSLVHHSALIKICALKLRLSP